MKYLFNLFTAITIVVLINSCGASSGINFSTRNLDKLEIGVSSRGFVGKHFNKPYVIENVTHNHLESTFYYYFYSQKPLGSLNRIDKKELYLEFINDTLNGILYNYSFDSTNDFEIERKNDLSLNKSYKQDIINIFGEPIGEFHLPSNFINYIVNDHYANNIPHNSTLTMIYYYAYAKKVPSTFNEFINHKKFLLFYLDNDGRLIEIISDELEIR